MSLEQLIASYGYLALVAGTFLEGETVMVIGGFFAHQGYLDFPYVVLAGFAGTVAGDQLVFFIGRKKGMKMIERRASWRGKSEKVRNMMLRNKNWLTLSFRFMYGVRTLTPLMLGASGVGPMRFVLLNGLGAMIWAIAIGSLGYFIGRAAEALLRDVERYEVAVMLVIAIVGLAVWIIHRVLLSKRSKRAG